MSLTLARVCCIAAIVCAACSSTPESAKPLPFPDIDKPISIAELWRYSAGDSSDFAFRPAVTDDGLFVAEADGWVSRLQVNAGGASVSRRWNVKVAPQLTGGAAAGGNIVIVGTLRGEVIALSAADGKAMWRVFLGAEIIAPAAIADGIVVVRSGDNRIYGLDVTSGARKWTFQRPIPSLSVRSTSAPVIAEQLAFAGLPGGKVVAINIKSGATIWEGTVSLPKGANELERIADVVASPVIGAKELCAVAYQGRLACFDLSNGNLLWAKDVSSAVGLALDHRSVIVTDDSGNVSAFDRESGGSLWKQTKLVNRPVSAPFIHQGWVIVADGSGYVHLLSREDGQFRGRFKIGGGMVSVPLQAIDGGVLIQTRSGALVAIKTD